MPIDQAQIPVDTVKIVVMRSGNKAKNSLTSLGEKQIKAAIKALLIKRGFDFGHIAHSPTMETWQCAEIAQNAILDRAGHHIFVYRAIEALSFESPFAEVFYGDMKAYEKDLQEIVEAENTVAVALQRSSYAELAHFYLSKYLFGFAEEIANLGNDLGRKEAICFSDSPLHTLAVPEEWAASIPYGAPEASCVIYTIQDRTIIHAEFVLAPLVE